MTKDSLITIKNLINFMRILYTNVCNPWQYVLTRLDSAYEKWLQLLNYNLPVAILEIKVFLPETNQSDPSEDQPLVQQSGSTHTFSLNDWVMKNN